MRLVTLHLLFLLLAATPVVLAGPLITEFMADNETTLADEDGEFSDWIEVHNPDSTPVDLTGWCLTDNADNLSKWPLPAVTLESGGFVVIFASGKDRSIPGSELHTNFQLSSDGEYLALVEPDGTTVAYQYSPEFPGQDADRSYGLAFDGDLQEGDPFYFDDPTPGRVNSAHSTEGKVADTKFNPDRGFYDRPFRITITTATPGASIRYTTDGSTPTATRGLLYTVPISIRQTTTLRAVAFKTGLEPTNVDTQTYIMVKDIVTQTSSAPPGWPSGSVNGQVYRYGMDSGVVNNSDPAIGGVEQVKDALLSIPTLSIVLDQASLTSSGTGIYSNPSGSGSGWEREASLELIHPPGWVDPDGNSEGFQTGCGLRIRGGFSRRTQTPKHSFRLFFRSEYGNGRLNYKLFGDEGADEFDKIDLRGPQNYSWAMGGTSQNSFIRDTWSRDLQGEMGHPYKRSRWYHLYLNGIYWGMCETDERAEANYGEIYFGGDQLDYDVVKSFGGVTDGNRSSYQ